MRKRPTIKAVILICTSLLLGAPNVQVMVDIDLYEIHDFRTTEQSNFVRLCPRMPTVGHCP